ncbi:hypothetical protein Ancab_028352, partial [Ancistrocladus abbreviatus]
DYDGCKTITSWVKGKNIVLGREYLTSLLGCKDDGPFFEQKKDKVKSNPSFHYDLAFERMGISLNMTRGGQKIVYMKWIRIPDCLVIYMLSYNVLPKAGGINEA